MLNVIVHENYTNPHYQTLVNDRTHAYESKAECTIYFEIDGPYRAMVITALQRVMCMIQILPVSCTGPACGTSRR